jgi:myo-inositol-1(or 4)-monophosphatase
MNERVNALAEIASFPKEIQEDIKNGLYAALKAGDTIKSLYSNSHDIRYKGRIDLVTEADIASEEIILESLSSSGKPVMAEESGMSGDSDTDYLWIVDPLDGTTNFAHGFQVFAVSIAMAIRDKGILQPKMGIVYCPMQDELFWAVEGYGAWLENRPISVSTVGNIAQSLIGTGFPYAIIDNIDYVMQSLKNVITQAQGIRRAGAAAVDLAWVAAGRLDGFYEIALKPWDVAAGALIVNEAGGKITDFSMNDFHPEMHETLASNGLIHEALASLVKMQA